tara:strand:- start:116 stop:541 length:426 start_codon:yes stop_codon:yes gene_type:complete
MILRFFKNDRQQDDKSELVDIACLLIHAAKIDENYTEKEKGIIKNTLSKLNTNKENVDKLILEAEKKELDSNHIQDFTKNIKNMEKENKVEIIKTIWTIILSDGNSDMYEENLMRRLAGLLYIDDRTVGEIKLKIKKNQLT